MRRLIVLILAAIIAAAAPTADAGCSSLGAGASYDYLGDSSMDIGMSSYDEFLRENVANSSVSSAPASALKIASLRMLKLNLSGGGWMDLQIESIEESVRGSGNLTVNNESRAVEVAGTLKESILALNATAPGGEVYRLGLGINGSRIIGEYRGYLPDGERTDGTAEGWWDL
ncbi:MAG: hypothetical protein ACP5OU_03015 [Methanothrix sp.]